MPYKEETVLRFIARFSGCGRNQEVIEVFTQGCCYWFAWILKERFPSGTLMYDPVVNHFACRIAGKDYDITGNISGRYQLEPWNEYPDETEKRRIKRNCINF